MIRIRIRIRIVHWFKARIRAHRIYLIARRRLTAEAYTNIESARGGADYTDDDLEQIAYIAATVYLERRQEKVMKIKVRRACKAAGVEIGPDKEWLLMSERERREVLERMNR